MPDPNQSQNSNTPLAGNIPVQSDLPPMPADFKGSTANSSPVSDFFPPTTPTPPKKKFGNPNRIVATILGVLLLIGGIGAGITLIIQPQLLQQKAVEPQYIPIQVCASGRSCVRSQIPGSSSCTQPGTGDVIFCCGPGSTITSNNTCSSTLPACPSSGVICSSTPLTGGSKCSDGGKESYCCGSNEYISGGTCVPDNNKVTCTSDKDCSTGYLCRTGRCFLKTLVANCGNSQCQLQDCHCIHGDVCDAWQCESGTRSSCGAQGRSWCSNYQGNAMTCCASGYVCNPNGYGCVPSGGGGGNTPPPTSPPTKTPTPPPGKTPTPTPGITAVCSAVKAYTSGWTLLSSSQLSALKPGNNLNFCVAGTTSAGAFDKAKFTINGTAQAETTVKRPNTNDYCQSYVIPSGVTSFTVTAQIHHATLGWVGP